MVLLPNFIICGAQRSGTTSLYHYLAQHPDVFMAAKKEIHYFSRNYNQGVDWYAKHFEGGDTYAIRGEASPTYLDTPKVPERIFSLLPEVKLCFILRDPIERAYSSYQHGLTFSQGEPRAFGQVIREPSGYQAYVERGFYYQYLCDFLELFKREQLHIMVTEDLKEKPTAVIRECFDFLEVDTSFVADLSMRFNVSQPIQQGGTLTLQRYWRKFKGFLLHTQLFSPAFRRQTARMRQVIGGVFFSQKSTRNRQIAEVDRAYLVAIYKEQVASMEELLGRSLPWLKEDE